MATSPSVKFDEFTKNYFQIQEDNFSMSVRLYQDLKADSYDLVVYVMELEEKFDVVILDEQAEKIQTIGDAKALVLSKIRLKDT